MHPRRQDIACLACGKRFPRAALILKHIEDGQCNISPTRHRQERAERSVAKEVFLERYNQESGSYVSTPNQDHQNTPPWPTDDQSWAQLGHDPHLAAETTTEPFSMDEMAEKIAETDINVQPNPASTLLPPTHTANGSQASSVPATIPSTFKMTDFWCPQRRIYRCPGANCGEHFKTEGDFHAHLSGPAHGNGRVTCPSCLKHFNSNYALLCHMEAPSRRCQIRHSTDYSEWLRELTAGLLDTGGYFADGTVKYIMPEDQGWQA